jgi:hypothetical protein
MRGPVALLLVSLTLVPGCGLTTLRDVEVAHAKGAGTTRLYVVRQDKALALTMDVLRQAGAEDVTANQSADSTRSVPGEVLATVKGFSVSFVGVWVAPQDAEHTNVTVVSRGASSVAVAHQLGEDAFHEKFAARLAASPPTAPPAPAVAGAH